MVFSFARIGAALGMRVEDVFVQNRRLRIRLREKGGKWHEVPCHNTLEPYLHAYLDETGIGDDPNGPLFRTIGRDTGQLTQTLLPKPTPTPLCNGASWRSRSGPGSAITFSVTGITAYLKNKETLENAGAMANHGSTRTTQLHDRRRDQISFDEVERISV